VRPPADRSTLAGQWFVGVLAALAGLGLLYAMLTDRGREEPAAANAEERRGYYLSDATLTEMGADGQPRLAVRAKQIEQQLADESVRLETLKLDYRTESDGLWTVTADAGRMPPDRGSLLLSGNVVVQSRDSARGPEVHSETLAYDTRTNTISTSDIVNIRFGHNDLRGRGLEADLNTGKLRLESNVDGRFVP
jgi:LPS export ABC transporter protein LptC